MDKYYDFETGKALNKTDTAKANDFAISTFKQPMNYPQHFAVDGRAVFTNGEDDAVKAKEQVQLSVMQEHSDSEEQQV